MVRIPFFDFDEPEPEPAEDPAVAQAAAEAAHEAADRAAREVLYGREHAYAIRFGNDALRREQPALAAIDRGYRAARAGLSPEARAAFDAGADARRQAWRDQIQAMAADQRAKLKLESARLRQNYAAYDLYQAVDRRDHDAADAHADLLHEAALRHGQLSGLDPAAAQAQAAGKVGETIASGITRVAAADPQAAQAALDRHGARMGEEHRAMAQVAVADAQAEEEPGAGLETTAPSLYTGPATPLRHGMMDDASYFLPTEDGRDNVGGRVGVGATAGSPPPPRQQRQPLHDLADKAVDLARKKVREGKAWAEDKADELRDNAIGFAVDQAMRFPELRKAAPPLMRASELIEGQGEDALTDASRPPAPQDHVERVDWSIIDLGESPGGVPILKGYVPRKTIKGGGTVIAGHSGVTIANGVDLGSRSVASLRALGLDESLVQTLAPYALLKKGLAVQALQARPLMISMDQAKALDLAVHRDELAKLVTAFDRDSSVGPFYSLPGKTQTAITDLYFEFGLQGAPKFWNQITTGRWEEAQRNLATIPSPPERKERRAQLLMEDVKAGTLPRRSPPRAAD